MANSRIAACVLTRNNEETIASCLLSVLPHADELLVVDTGSTDRTLHIVEENGVRYFKTAWNGDFAEIRNLAASMTEADWIWFIDSDEEFVWGGQAAFKEWLLGQEPENTLIFQCEHLEASTGELLSITHVERCYNKNHYRFQGRIHEALFPLKGDKKAIPCPVGIIKHVGYSHKHMPSKSKRNIQLLEAELAENSEGSGRVFRYLANEYYHMERYDECTEYAEEALKRLPDEDVYSRSQAYFYLSMALFRQKKLDEAMDTAFACIEEIPQYADAYAILLECLFIQEDWATFVSIFPIWDKLLKGETWLPHHYFPLYDDFLLRLADAYANMGEDQKAIETLLVAVHRKKRKQQALVRLHTYFADLDWLEVI